MFDSDGTREIYMHAHTHFLCSHAIEERESHKLALRMFVAATDDSMQIINATCDFWKGIINALKDEFGKPIIGCLFHLKNAIYGKS